MSGTAGAVTTATQSSYVTQINKTRQDIKNHLEPETRARAYTPTPNQLQSVVEPTSRDLKLGATIMDCEMHARAELNSKDPGERLTSAEYGQLKTLIENVASIGKARSKSFDSLKQKEVDIAFNSLINQAMNDSMKSASQQAHQLRLLERLIDFVEQNPLNQDSWDRDNHYRHYIRNDHRNPKKVGKEFSSPAAALEKVCSRVSEDLKQQQKLTPETARDIGALLTAVAKEYKDTTHKSIKTHNTTVSQIARLNTEIQQLKAADENNPSIKTKENEIEELKNSGELINGSEEIIVIGSKVEGWDKYRGDGKMQALNILSRYVFGITLNKAKHAQLAETPRATPETEGGVVPTKERFATSRFGPSMTVWNTTLFLETMLGASLTEQKVYAATQATDWAMAKDSKYNGPSKGAHTPIEAMMTFAEAHGADHKTAHAKETLVRLILESNPSVEDGNIEFDRPSAENTRQASLIDQISSRGKVLFLGIKVREAEVNLIEKGKALPEIESKQAAIKKLKEAYEQAEADVRKAEEKFKDNFAFINNRKAIADKKHKEFKAADTESEELSNQHKEALKALKVANEDLERAQKARELAVIEYENSYETTMVMAEEVIPAVENGEVEEVGETGPLKEGNI
ncbi:hypothetical protein [Marinibactrum halimedae]|uniref:Uncharacterized protein n=1 Tax=Marinibactrum halimedae TaxID=1444977 RepID=A0AA37WMZ0_9GAMM|nr:hypothetical protein [Marinibactrum halimedae]MCD9460316.1 hypothetical protein [Marinibactrum halimedae]GLS26750.1 hypothetical protein GCM10007877_24690 [Marinibactrum halimedae]